MEGSWETNGEVWIHRPGRKILSRYEAPVGENIVLDVKLRSRGPLKVSYPQMNDIEKGMDAVKRMAPFCSVIFCNDLDQDSLKGDGIESICGLMIYPHDTGGGDWSEPTMFITTDCPLSGIIRSTINHECFHANEMFLTPDEQKVMYEWGEYLNEVEPPNFVKEKKLYNWWSRNFERVAWSFESFCYVMTPTWKDLSLSENHSFPKSIDFYPDDVFHIFRSVWNGEIAKRF